MRAALELFGARGYNSVGVGELATRSGVTTGSLYHHFGSKLGLYALVRADVEQRAVDRMRGAAAVAGVVDVPAAAPVLLVGFDYLVGSGYALLLGEEHPVEGESGGERDDGDHAPNDPIAELLAELLDSAGVPLSVPLAAAWRACLRAAAADRVSARAALTGLLAR